MNNYVHNEYGNFKIDISFEIARNKFYDILQ